MEYFDLNLQPALLNSQQIPNGIGAIICDLISKYHQQEYFNKIALAYDENKQTLIINDNKNKINLLDFMQTGTLPNKLTNGINALVANKINVIISSEMGTFSPIIRNKEGMSKPIHSLFITYDYSNANKKEGTKITLTPINLAIVNKVKPHFSFLQQWTKALQTNSGFILIANDANNNLYLNGKNVTVNNTKEQKYHFIFSYDINQDYFDENLFKHLDEWNQYAPECINKILQQLNDEDKEQVYVKLINDDQSYEWNNQAIRATVIKYLTNLKTSTYVIATKDDKKKAYEEFAKKVNIIPIWLNDHDEYTQLWVNHTKTLDDFEEQYGKDHIDLDTIKFVNPANLNKNEKRNWKTVMKFLDYFIDYIDLEDELADYEEEEEDMDVEDVKNIKIVENLPTVCSWYSDDKFGIIDRSHLCELQELFDQVSTIVCSAIHWDYYSFSQMWNEAILQELDWYYLQEDHKLN